MDLTEAMYAATESAPPTRIDVDALIAGERRRSLRRHRLTAAGVVMAALAGTLALPQTGTNPPPPPPCPEPSFDHGFVVDDPPRVPVVEDCHATIARLSVAVTAVVRRELRWVDLSPMPAVVQRQAVYRVGYSAGFQVGPDPILHSTVYIEIYAARSTPAEFREMAAKKCPVPRRPGDDCTITEIDGAVLLIDRGHYPGGERSDTSVEIVRADGTGLRVSGRGTGLEAIPPPFGEAEIVAIATAPELTLYP
ncbi:hypothetical protein KZZ52_59645 [Dactylosporangium sp. AC04546]|uniref:hypothetical protein n=1 Tax=Dactylosporangium sp. AC04546 TaxID=2862460 RepID=UPI001EDFF1B0|nr:hypothetical protein [Dactylosporangium sp. AC04546]WVK83795.1 hypothetical protein KZZ52_59645 [Dactylosporangium sp. AC04546]